LGQAVVFNVQLATGGDLGGNEAVRHPGADADRLLGGSGVSREAPAPFCERPEVKLLRPTRHGLHWVLDVTMNEDGLRNRKDHGPENLALLRRLALNLATLEPSKASIKGKLKRAGWDNAYLVAVLAQAAKSQVR